jgi:subtilase family serine protease
MPRSRAILLVVLACAFLLVPVTPRALAQSGANTRPLITQNLDESKLASLGGNTRPEVTPANDRGIVANDFLMEHMLLQLRRAPEQERSLQQFLGDLGNPQSPNFHRWLTAAQFGERFGLAQQDIDTITRWLESFGFQVNVVYPSGMLIDFSGTAEQVRQAFHTEIHRLDVKGASHVANMGDPKIPAALAPAVAGIVSLHDFRPHPMVKIRGQYTFTDAIGSTIYAVVPGDLATIYNFTPVFNSGVSGQGQTIALIEDTNLYSTSDWTTFRSTFGLSGYTSASLTQTNPAPPSGPNNCGNPGVNADDVEAIIDADYASAAAPSAAIQMASCSDTASTFGGLIAVQNLLNGNAPPSAMSISYGECEAVNGAAANASYNSAYQQAVAEGVSVFVAAGDSGGAGCDQNQTAATHGIGVNAFASTPYNVAVGGTDFSDTYSGTNSTYWSPSNAANYSSALSYVPETPWNDSCSGALLAAFEGYAVSGPNSFCNYGGGLLSALTGTDTTAAGGGGPSACATGSPSTSGVVSGSCAGYPKPSWQSVFGNPSDGVRDTPDVSFFAANGLWSHYYIFCYSDTVNGGAACTGSPSGWTGAGGTSFASPIMAGVQALINQKTNSRQGNPNPTLYSLASTEYGAGSATSCNSSLGYSVANSCIFYDVTLGDMAVDCTGANNCYDSAAGYGDLSTSTAAYQPAFGAATGWDFASGIGSLNVANLVNNWPGSSSNPDFSLSASPGSVTVTQGAQNATTITLNPLNGFSSAVTLSASGLPSGVTAGFSPDPATASSTLTLTASSTATTGTVTVTITGISGALTHTTSVTLTVNPASKPDFSLSASPSSLSIVRGRSGSTAITVTPSNGFIGNVSLSASKVSGVTSSFTSSTITTSGSSTLKFTVSSTATTGTFTVTVTGTSSGPTHTTKVTLKITRR